MRVQIPSRPTKNMAPSSMGKKLAFQAGKPGSSPGGVTYIMGCAIESRLSERAGGEWLGATPIHQYGQGNRRVRHSKEWYLVP